MKQFNQRSRGKARLALTAGMALAMAFTVSCFLDEGDDDSWSSSSLGGVSSSSGGTTQYSSSSRTGGSVGPTPNGAVTIGTQVWMSRNLDTPVEGSKCYSNQESNCDKYGRLYNWSTAMALPSSCNENTCSSQIHSPHRGICPSGWHLPSRAEWEVMTAFIGGASTEGKKLRATSGWNNNGNGTDEYGFSALPGGSGYSGGSFDNVGDRGHWWSASEYSSNGAYRRSMTYYYEDAFWNSGGKSDLFSVRCLQD